MAGSVNKVTIIGNLGADPEVRSTQNGTKVVNLRIATGESWTDKATGERKEKTEWHRVVVFNERAAAYAETYLRKGSKVYVEGALQTRKWTDKDGRDQYTTEIFLGPYKGELTGLSGQPSHAEGDEPAPQQTAAPRTQTRAARPAPVAPDLDDEIPF